MTNERLYRDCIKTANPRESFYSLRNSGMMWVLFPDSPSSWLELKRDVKDEKAISAFCGCKPDSM